MSTITLDALVDGLRGSFNDNVMRFFTAESIEAVTNFSEILLNNTAAAISSGDEATLASVKRTMRLLAEYGRITLVNATWDVVEETLSFFVSLARSLLVSLAAKVVLV